MYKDRDLKLFVQNLLDKYQSHLIVNFLIQFLKILIYNQE